MSDSAVYSLKQNLPRNITKGSKIQKNPTVTLDVLILHARSVFYSCEDKAISCPQSVFWALAAISGISFMHGRHRAPTPYRSAHKLLLTLRDLMQFFLLILLLYSCNNVFFFLFWIKLLNKREILLLAACNTGINSIDQWVIQRLHFGFLVYVFITLKLLFSIQLLHQGSVADLV